MPSILLPLTSKTHIMRGAILPDHIKRSLAVALLSPPQLIG